MSFLSAGLASFRLRFRLLFSTVSAHLTPNPQQTARALPPPPPPVATKAHPTRASREDRARSIRQREVGAAPQLVSNWGNQDVIGGGHQRTDWQASGVREPAVRPTSSSAAMAVVALRSFRKATYHFSIPATTTITAAAVASRWQEQKPACGQMRSEAGKSDQRKRRKEKWGRAKEERLKDVTKSLRYGPSEARQPSPFFPAKLVDDLKRSHSLPVTFTLLIFCARTIRIVRRRAYYS